MQAGSLEGYTPAAEFVEDSKDPLVELDDLSDSKELWLIQWSANQDPNFRGQEATLELDHEGKICSIENSSGKAYDLVNYSCLAPDASVFVSSASGAKIVGKISRRVSIVHYPEPSDFENNKRPGHGRSSTATTSSNLFSTPSRSIMRDGSRGSRSAATSSLSGRQRSALSEEKGQPSLPPKRRATGEGSEMNLGRVQMGVTSSGSLKKKSKTKSKN